MKRFAAVIALLTCSLFAQELASRPAGITPAAPKAPNTHAVYQQLRNVQIGSEAYSVSNFVLKKDVATFTFNGSFSLLAPVNGKVTGAVFSGNGTVKIEPVLAVERAVMDIYSKGGYLEQFSSLVIRFTDDTAAEIKKAGPPTAASGNGELADSKDRLRHTLHYNLDGRILNDVLSKEPGGLFWAFIKGKKGDKQLFEIDPNGVVGFSFDGPYFGIAGFTPQRLGPSEVLFQTYTENDEGVWLCEHFASEYAKHEASGSQPNELVDLNKHVIATQIEKSGKISGDDTITFAANQDGVSAIYFDLFHKLRVQSVTGMNGEALDFIQEGEKDDWGFFVVLPRPLHSGEEYTLRTVYAGKDAINNTGGGNYDVNGAARGTWYPNSYLGDYADYELTFKVPKKMKVAATGKLVREADEGDFSISEWKSTQPMSVAGLSFGKFKGQSVKLDKEGLLINAYANDDQPDWVKRIQQVNSHADDVGQGMDRYHGEEAALGTMSTIPLLKRNLSEGQLAMQLYTAYFGKASIDQLNITQQTPCTYGQAWPGLVYLPVCAFFDSTVRNELNLTDTRGYWEVVGPHEVAHQWWGHTVGFDSYADQWMSEGFAELSASIFLQQFYKTDKYQKFWHDELQLLTEKNRFGFRAIDAGPVTLGYRLSTPKTGYEITRRLIYPKGGFILHMVRMMMYDRVNGDKAFQAMMQDFVSTYRNKVASTEDFKAMVEKHMIPQMNLDGNGKLDWFFNQYVYGTQLPQYTFEHSIAPAGPGQFKMHFKITQSGVRDDFKMLVPIYLELANGTQVKLGAGQVMGNNSLEQDVMLPIKDAPRRALINANYDVLAAPTN